MNSSDDCSRGSMHTFYRDLAIAVPLLAAVAIGSWWYMDTPPEVGALSFFGGIAAYTILELHQSKKDGIDEP